MKLTLNYPILFDGKKLTEIELSRPKGKHLKFLPTSPGLSDLIDMAVRVSGQPEYVFDEMDASDVTRVCEVLSDFLAGGQPTGTK